MDKIREEFEVHAKKENLDLAVIPNGTYYLGTTFQAWQAWQASRAALVVELPKENYHSNTEYEEELVVRLDRAGIRYE